MKKTLILAILIAFAAIAGAAQTTECPVDKVCISREAAVKALQDDDKVKAQTAEISVKDQAIAELKKEIARMQIELAKSTGELTGSQAMNARQHAIIDLLLKSVRPKKVGFINF